MAQFPGAIDTFGITGVEADFILSAIAVDRVLCSEPAAEKASAGYSPTDTTLGLRIIPALSAPILQITIEDDDGFGPGRPGAAESLLRGRSDSDVGSPGSVMLAVPKETWINHGDITVQTTTSTFDRNWQVHTAADEQELLEEEGGFFSRVRGAFKKLTNTLSGDGSQLNTLSNWLAILNTGRSVNDSKAVMTRVSDSPTSPIFQANHANCFSQVSVPWLVEEETVKQVRISALVILTDSEYVSVGAEFIARKEVEAKESYETEHNLFQFHDLLSTPACQRP